MKTDQYLTPEQAAVVAGMSRPAFLKHVGKSIVADMAVGKDGKRSLFLRSAVVRWRKQREQNGAKRRGPRSTANGHKK